MALPCQSGERSIIQYMTDLHNQNKGEFIEKLYKRWKDILDKLEIHPTVRQQFDWWFQRCYKERDSGQHSALYEDFLREQAIVDDFLLKQELIVIQKYQNTEWVQKAVDCVREEKELMQRCIEEQNRSIDKENIQRKEGEVTKVLQLHKEIDRMLKLIEKSVTQKAKLEIDKDDYESNLFNLNEVIKRKHKDVNGRILDRHNLESSIETCKKAIRKLEMELASNKQTLMELYQDVNCQLSNLVPSLLQEVKAWQDHYKLKYAELGRSRSLEDIESWCADVGLILYELTNARLPKWQELLGVGLSQKERETCCLVTNTISGHYHQFIESTFIVTEQEDFIVKTDKKYLPKTKVRILALDKVQLGGQKICAYFVREEDLQTCSHGNEFQLQTLCNLSHPLNQNKLTVCRDKKFRDRFEVTFDKLAFKTAFNRTAQDKKPFVHEEKYRMVFHTEIMDMNIITLSLPLVVTTGANQGCCALASIMWQCYSTDVYVLPIQSRPALPWTVIAGMLKAKFSKLSDKRTLSKENITHLKRRLLGSEHKPDDTEVSLNEFCFDKMNKADNPDQQHSFSFWKWFLANYNLLDKYLKQYWEDNLIGGFLSKEDVEQMFKQERMQKTGTFILRFSDNHINDSQGINSVFGYLTGMVSRRVEEDGVKTFKLHSTEVADHKKLKEKNLANILKESQSKSGQMIFQHLYPGNRPREECFDKYWQAGTVVAGYTGRRDAFIVDLEQDMHVLRITTGKHRRNSGDSGFGPMSPQSEVGTKRVRGQQEPNLTIKSLLSKGSPRSPSQYSGMSSPAQSPAQMPFSPDPVLSPASQQYDPVSPASPRSIQSQLPTMLQNGLAENEVDGQRDYHTISSNDFQGISSSPMHPGIQQQSCIAIANSGMNGNFSLPPTGMQVVGNSHGQPDIGSYQVCELFTDDFGNRQMSNGFTSYPNEPVVSCSSAVTLTCPQVNQIQQNLMSLSQSDPQQFQNCVGTLLGRLPTDQLQDLERSLSSSSHPSPMHPSMEMDNTPNDFVGFFQSINDELENGNHANSGNIDVTILDSIQEDANNL